MSDRSRLSTRESAICYVMSAMHVTTEHLYSRLFCHQQLKMPGISMQLSAAKLQKLGEVKCPVVQRL